MSDDFDQRDLGEEIPPPGISTAAAVIFYALMVFVAVGVGHWWLDLDLLEWHNRLNTALWLDATIGAATGLVVVLASRGFEKYTDWARTLNEEFRKILGEATPTQVLVLAVTSGIGEEVFFRGFLQQALSDLWLGSDWLGLIIASVVFGLIHVGPDRRKFLPWTIMAVVMGFGFGLIYLFTGNILGAVVAHFTINFFNLLHIAGDQGEADE